MKTKAVQHVAQSIDIENIEGNYCEGCLFSPDGLCVLTATSADRKFRLVSVRESEYTCCKLT